MPVPQNYTKIHYLNATELPQQRVNTHHLAYTLAALQSTVTQKKNEKINRAAGRASNSLFMPYSLPE
jgi:hypothetical protein